MAEYYNKKEELEEQIKEQQLEKEGYVDPDLKQLLEEEAAEKIKDEKYAAYKRAKEKARIAKEAKDPDRCILPIENHHHPDHHKYMK